MRKDPIRSLAECSEFRQTLEARPPVVVHGTALVLAVLLGVAFAWAALTKANLVVRAVGRVRPIVPATRVTLPAGGEIVRLTSGGRVRKVAFRLGDAVTKDQELVALDTEQLDIEIARRRRVIETSEEQLAGLERESRALGRKYAADRNAAELDLAHAEEQVANEKARRAAQAAEAQEKVRKAADDVDRLRRVVAKGADSQEVLAAAESRLREAKHRLAQAAVPVDEKRVAAQRARLAQAEEEHGLRKEELSRTRTRLQGEAAAARSELQTLAIERRRAILRSPITGVVTDGHVKPGDVLEPGKPVFEVAEQSGFLFEAAVPSDEVGHLRVGLPVRIRLDPYDYQKYGVLEGTVRFLSPDSVVLDGPGGKKAPFYLMRVELKTDAVERNGLRGELKFGMGGTAEVVTGQESILMLLLKKVRQAVSLT